MPLIKKICLLIIIVFLSGCEAIHLDNDEDQTPINEPITLGIDPHDTIYQLQVYAFHDSNDDGLGDFKGIAEKVDYFTFLGIDAIWLSPIHPSQSYHHYDVIDYFAVDPAYVVDDFTFEDLLDVLHAHGIDVILDIVVNHSSNEHPYFIEALRAFKQNQESPYIDYYILSDTPFNHPTLGYPSAYQDGVYYDAFYGVISMPAFNYDNPAIKDMFIDIFSYWLDLGVAGFRLDAAKHIYDDLEKNIDVLTYFVDTLALTYGDVYFINEIWASQNEVIPYFQSGMSNFNFDARNRIASTLAGDRSYASYLEQYQQAVRNEHPYGIEASFLSNHDIGRLGVGYSESEQKLMAALNILVPGNSYVYYGDETMLTGERILNQGYQGYLDATYRTPMLWDDWTYPLADYLVEGTSGAIKSGQTTSRVTVEAALENPDSLLNYYQTLIGLKNNLPIFSTGTLSEVSLDASLITYQIREDDHMILVIHNLNDTDKTLTHASFESITGFVSQTTSPTLLDQQLIVPALSSVIITLNDTLEDEDTPLEAQGYLMSNINNWTENSDYLMVSMNDSFTITITFNETSQFKVKVGDRWYGYNDVIQANGIAIEAEPTYDNIIIPAGTYVITLSQEQITIE